MKIRVAVITASTTGYAGKREDISGAKICEIVEKAGMEVTFKKILPDDRETLAKVMAVIADSQMEDLVLPATGGTGFSKTDCTPEATTDICERLVPGIPEAMRAASMKYTKRAMLSRRGGRDPKGDADHQSAGKSEGSGGKSCGDSGGSDPWCGDSDRTDCGVCEKMRKFTAGERPLRVLIKGAGDLASGIAVRLYHSGFQVIMTETGEPTTIRRYVAFSRAIYESEAEVEGISAKCVSTRERWNIVWSSGKSRSSQIRHVCIWTGISRI